MYFWFIRLGDYCNVAWKHVGEIVGVLRVTKSDFSAISLRSRNNAHAFPAICLHEWDWNNLNPRARNPDPTSHDSCCEGTRRVLCFPADDQSHTKSSFPSFYVNAYQRKAKRDGWVGFVAKQ